jgi:hypothetical protein
MQQVTSLEDFFEISAKIIALIYNSSENNFCRYTIPHKKAGQVVATKQ